MYYFAFHVLNIITNILSRSYLMLFDLPRVGSRGSGVAKILLAVIASDALSAAVNVDDAANVRFLYSPALHRDKVAFIHGSEIWAVGIQGGAARQLTRDGLFKSHLKFSKDGRQLAYSAETNGNMDVYTLDLRTRAEPVRRTWHPGKDQVRGWNAKGDVLFSSNRAHFAYRYADLYLLGGDAGLPARLPIGKAAAADFGPGDKHLVYAPIADATETWKRYRGGMTTPLWIVDLSDYSHVEIPHKQATDTSPVWVGDTIYFRSDRTGARTLHTYDIKKRRVSQIKIDVGSDIDSFDADAEKIIFASEGYLYRYDLASSKSQRLAIMASSTEKSEAEVAERNVAGEIANAALSPNGKTVVFEAHGDIFIVDRNQSDATNLTQSPGTADRDPVWAADGKHIAFLSDQGGEYAYHVRNVSKPSATSRHIPLGTPGYGSGAVFSPDSKRLAYIDDAGKLWWSNLEEGIFRPIDILAGLDLVPVWSSSGSSLYVPQYEPKTGYAALAEVDLVSGKIRQLTDPMASVASLSLSADGNSLYFLASNNAGPTRSVYDISGVMFQHLAHWSVYSIDLKVLAANRDNILIRRHPITPRNYAALHALGDSRLLLERKLPQDIWASYGVLENAGATEARFFIVDPNTGKETVLEQEIAEYQVSRQASTILAATDDGLSLISWGPDGKVGAVPMQLAVAMAENDPPAEYSQIYEETWRTARDFFYDPKLHGVDWEAMRTYYRHWVRDVRHREDLYFVLQKLLSELVNSHVAVGAREAADIGDGPQVAMLGADFVYDDKGYRIARVLTAPFWSEIQSPLPTEAEGRYLTAIDGTAINPSTSLYRVLSGIEAKFPLKLTLSSSETDATPMVVEVKPLSPSQETLLRYRLWVEEKRAYVDRASGGRIAYVHQPDTSEGGLTQFIKYYFAQTDKQAIIIDERYNNGGADPDYQLDVLGRTPFLLYAPRDMPFFPSPISVIDGPKVMLTNAEAGSGGDVFPYQFKRRELGTVIGTRTWGGANGGFRGAWPESKIDGGYVRIPDLGAYSPEGSYILENTGFIPDIEVELYPKDYAAGRDTQLSRAVDFLLKQLKRGNTGTELPKKLERVNRSMPQK